MMKRIISKEWVLRGCRASESVTKVKKVKRMPHDGGIRCIEVSFYCCGLTVPSQVEIAVMLNRTTASA